MPKIEIVTFSTLYPNNSQPNHGVFVQNRLRFLVESEEVSSRVLAPVPWFPFSSVIFGQYGKYASIPQRIKNGSLPAEHPRFPVLPKLGMTIAPLFLFIFSIRRLALLKAQRDFDLIDAHYFYPDGVAAILLGKLFKKPVVITARGTDVNFIPQFYLPKLMIQAAAKAASGIVAVSHAIKSAIVELGIPPDAITVLRNGVDLETFHARGRQAARSELKLSRRTLLSVGQLIERKGHALVIDALKSLPECDLLIAGEGPEQNALQKFAAEIGVADRVRFLGNVDHHALQKVYVASDALVLASSREGWPNVLLEAMACGTPVVATPIWGNPEVVSAPEAGVLTRSRDTPSIVDAVKKLFRNLPDRMRTRAYAEKFSWKETTDGQILLFKKILNAAQ